MNIETHSEEFDKWLGEWMWEDFWLEPWVWRPTQDEKQAIQVLKEFIKRTPGWYVEIVYDITSDFPWVVMLRPLEGLYPEYTPMASGYPLPLMICKVVILALTNGEIVSDEF